MAAESAVAPGLAGVEAPPSSSDPVAEPRETRGHGPDPGTPSEATEGDSSHSSAGQDTRTSRHSRLTGPYRLLSRLLSGESPSSQQWPRGTSTSRCR